ncbi:VCBS repeat-containing protein [Geobacter sp. DSM 9736]|uniref:FG-GAP repeat domain-containing protein n=1 Tax=Geobacter sp. DSM 9736 TaxID=1277350 RepID=UPI000B4FED51|nr:VCBS repeat-containing protein [Geobacter sp. DSM 9736]SNB47337.1 hypothetical protein SAMN06269301_2816 [Geobacter sp. DSM 9736]
MKRLILSMLFLMTLLSSLAGAAAPTAFVEPFKVVGAGDAELSSTLQTLLVSRLSGGGVPVQDAAKDADAVVKGIYIQLGKVFSVDVTVRDRNGAVLARAFEQGERQEELLGAITKIAQKLQEGLAGTSSPKVSAPAIPTVTPSPTSEARPATDVVKKNTAGRQISGVLPQRLPGIYVGMAPAHEKDGGREIFLIKERSLHVMRADGKMEQVAEAALASDDKALSVDTADLDGDGAQEAYLTVFRGNELASQVWAYKEGRLVRVAENLPYFFRAVGPWKSRRLYAQQMGRAEDFYGPVHIVKKAESGYELADPIKLPKFANIFNFNRFQDRDGNLRFIVLHPDGFLVVFDASGEELWRSNDKYGGSEAYFSRDDQERIRITGSAVRKVFIEQRITVTGDGEIIVPQNTGFWVLGNSRSYSKNVVYGLAWNGVALEEVWQTNVSQNYLSDYLYDEVRKQLVLLEVVKKEGFAEKGASAVSVKTVE